ncbi:GDSL-type esterase/lipase family protein [Blastopirellula sp. J2-11]|nr:GDSL-type esterase/lipase family protein [Blastopirellula sp. J2-11]
MGAPEMDPGGYRKWLFRRINSELFSADFVGSQKTNPAPRMLPDDDHEGHSGFRIDEITQHVDEWLAAARPDIILLMIGTNDMFQDFDLSNAPQRMTKLLAKIRKCCPNAEVVVATIPLSTTPKIEARVQAYNQALPGVVAKAGGRVTLVDMYHIIAEDDIADRHRHGLHPTPTGYLKIADAWFDAIATLPIKSSGLRQSPPRLLHGWPLVEERVNGGQAGSSLGVRGHAKKLDTKAVRGVPPMGDFSLVFWAKASQADEVQDLLCVCRPPYAEHAFSLQLAGGRLGLRCGEHRITAPKKISAKRWHQFAFVRNGDRIILWVDATPYVARFPADNIYQGTLYLGDPAGERRLGGWINNVTVWSGALWGGQVNDQYRALLLGCESTVGVMKDP